METVIAGAQRKNAVISLRRSRLSPTTRSAIPWWPPSSPTPPPLPRSPSSPHLRPWGTPCRWTRGEDAHEPHRAGEQAGHLTGGRAAEELIFGPDNMTTGSNDIEQATKLARALVTRYGMTEEFDMVALETVQNQYLGATPPCPARLRRPPQSTARWWSWCARPTRRLSDCCGRTRPSSGSWLATSWRRRPSPARSSWSGSGHNRHQPPRASGAGGGCAWASAPGQGLPKLSGWAASSGAG